jgi:hypothetical protein
MTAENKTLAATAEREAAVRAFREAGDLLRLKHHGGAISRAYYAAYHAARALLYEKGLEPKTHEGVRRMIGLHYVLPGLIPQAEGDALAALALMREAADYAPSAPATQPEAEQAVELARHFLRAARVSIEA